MMPEDAWGGNLYTNNAASKRMLWNSFSTHASVINDHTVMAHKDLPNTSPCFSHPLIFPLVHKGGIHVHFPRSKPISYMWVPSSRFQSGQIELPKDAFKDYQQMSHL